MSYHADRDFSERRIPEIIPLRKFRARFLSDERLPGTPLIMLRHPPHALQNKE
jgi:hypothetical protein